MKISAWDRGGLQVARKPAPKVSLPDSKSTFKGKADWFAEIVESSDDAIISKDLRGVISSWNRGAQRLFGYEPAEAIGRPILFLIPPDRQEEEKAILARIARGEHVEHYETVRLRKDGRPVDVSLTISPVMDASGKIIGASKIARDISGRKENERALAAARSALLESEKQILAVSEAERQRIGADLHDNLGQQLTAIELLCQSMREDLRHQPELEARMGQVCRFLQESVAQTRHLARGLTPVSLDAEGLVDSLAEMVRRAGTPQVRCEFICPSSVELQHINSAGHLFRIAQEALNNALKHAKARKITITLAQDAGSVILKIADNGEGFPKFVKSAPGIGLQIMRHRANVIGATLEIQSTLGHGVTVTCTLRRPE